MVVFTSKPVECASTVVITAASTGFGGCVPPTGVSPANDNSTRPPASSPTLKSPKIKPVSVQTIIGLKINKASR